MAKYGIETSAMLVEFRASVWTARKLDKSTTDEVVATKNAGSKDAARVNKHLLAGRTELETINKFVNSMRNFVYSNTMPWSDTGIRLLPAVQFVEFDRRIQDECQKFWTLVADFEQIYPTLITAQAMALGAMFKRDDFPSADQIKHKFDIGVVYMPVPSSGDWRIDINNEAQKELAERLEKIADDRVEQAKQHVRNLMHEHLKRMSDRLVVESVNGKDKGRIFHDTLVDNGIELCEMVKALNITNDPEIEQIRSRMAQAMSGVTAEELRSNFAVRSEVKTNVDEILNKFSW